MDQILNRKNGICGRSVRIGLAVSKNNYMQVIGLKVYLPLVKKPHINIKVFKNDEIIDMGGGKFCAIVDGKLLERPGKYIDVWKLFDGRQIKNVKSHFTVKSEFMLRI